MNKKQIVLFDMDGTLTEPRKEFDKRLLQPLRELSNYADIGILTGSDLDYVNQQMDLLIRFSELRYKIHLLPCNGTKHLLPPKSSNEKFRLVHENDMRREIGETCFRDMMILLTNFQEEACYHPIPLTGHFISYRGSMINWCPIGRNANTEQRSIFQSFDNNLDPKFRIRTIDKLRYKINLRCKEEITVKLGGETSFDIYPTGWDKTYSLKHFPEHTHWFVGDRCDTGGNDQEIYELLKKDNKSFKTTSTEHTSEIIMKQIIPRLK
jgi:phosphomannomutase